MKPLRAKVGVAILAAFDIAACRRAHPIPPNPALSTSASVETDALARSARIAAIRTAEYARASAKVPVEALSDHDVTLRRAAARALARIGDEPSLARLRESLSDEDGEVVAWSAYGLGLHCAGREPAIVRALVTRATSLQSMPQAPDAQPGLSTIGAITDALGRCGTDIAERSLTAWLEGPADRAEGAALGLGRIADRAHRLDDVTVVALLDAAARPAPITNALYPVGRVESLSEASKKRLLDVAKATVARGGPARPLAIGSTYAAGPFAFDSLSTWVADERLSASERSSAAATLGHLGRDAAPALGAALAHLAPAGVAANEAWLTTHFAPLSAVLAALDGPIDGAADALTRLRELEVPKGATVATARRVVEIRCGAAAALSGSTVESDKLAHCDPDPHGRSGGLAMLRVLDRGELTGARYTRWKGLVASTDAAVRRAAIALLMRHPETPAISEALVSALGAHEPGVVAQAARVVAAFPVLVAGAPDEAAQKSSSGKTGGTPANAPARSDIVNAVGRALDEQRPPDQIESRVALMDAAAALGALSLKARVERYCTSSNLTLRKSAETALRSLAGARECPAVKALESQGIDPSAGAATLTFVTDAGRLGLRLEPADAPEAVARIKGLARSGFYTGMAIHRVVPGFVIQFGDPVGDGSGGSGQPPVPNETSPREFQAFSVGLALAGPDTGSSQIFITLSPQPQLSGDYPLLGRADPEWATVAPGDVVRAVEVRD